MAKIRRTANRTFSHEKLKRRNNLENLKVVGSISNVSRKNKLSMYGQHTTTLEYYLMMELCFMVLPLP
jgi:hypothetical protein